MRYDIVTATDIYNDCNIDLAARLGIKGAANETQVVNDVIRRAHNDVSRLIALYALYGARQAAKIFEEPCNAEALKRAIEEQLTYSLYNADARKIGGIIRGANGTETYSMHERTMAAFSPIAKDILETAGLLYRG